VLKIDALVNPQSIKTVSAPCPNCNSRFIYRRDSAGESVRQPALQIIAEVGCTCQACGAFWAPGSHLLLCR
jgi:uncharacterized protein with PIN domain